MRKIEKHPGAVYFGNDSWLALQEIIDKQEASSIAIIVDQNTKKHCLPLFQEKILLSQEPYIIEIQAGEMYKSIDTCLEVWNSLSKSGFDRSSLLINLGGGVVTDLGGFVASTYMRGIACINIPTSLLAMVDAAVGGKNGVDLGVLKNQIGIIRDPLSVIVDTKFLFTLPKKEVTSGYAEMLKHGLIYAENYWDELQNFEVTNVSETENLVWDSIIIKNKIVTQDQQEKGVRKTLNFGHTLGHAIESYCLASNNLPSLLHGEAIAIGMILALYISVKQVGFPKEKFEKAANALFQICGSVHFTDQDILKIIELLKHDKKNRSGKVLFVLLEDISKPVLNKIVDEELILKSFLEYKKLTKMYN